MKKMIREDRDILIADLYGRLPYGVMVKAIGWDAENNQEVEVAVRVYSINTDDYVEFGINDYDIEEYLIDDCKPYLRPMSSMTEEEEQEYRSLCAIQFDELADADTTIFYFDTIESVDWLNKKMFDFRGLIPKDLALSTDEFNPYV